MKKLLLVLLFPCCSHPFNLDESGNDQLEVCTSACYVGTAIRDDYREAMAYVEVLKVIDNMFKRRMYSRQTLVFGIQNSLANYPEPVRDKVVDDTLRIYDYLSNGDEIWGLQRTSEAIALNFRTNFFNQFLPRN